MTLLVAVLFGDLRSSLESSFKLSFTVSFSLAGVFDGMVLVSLSVSFCFLTSTEMSTLGWESFRLCGGGFVADMLMSPLVSELGSRSATDFLLIIERELSVQNGPRVSPGLASEEPRRRLAIFAGRWGVGRRPSTRFQNKLGQEASRYNEARDISFLVTSSHSDHGRHTSSSNSHTRANTPFASRLRVTIRLSIKNGPC